ncbi:hypothetical protein ACTHGU_01545 [Chitinophagaceae bacterium MMS25-I14]
MSLLYTIVLMLICASNFWLARNMEHRESVYAISGAGFSIALLAVVFQWKRIKGN